MDRLIIGNFLSFLSVIFTFISVVKKKKTDLIGWQLITVGFCIFSSIALFAYAALVTNCVSFVRNVLAYKNKLTPTLTCILAILCVVLGACMNNLGFIGWLAIIASTGYTILMYTTKNAQQMRYAVIVTSCLWVVHDFYVQSYPTVVSGICLIIWTLTQILKHGEILRPKKKA